MTRKPTALLATVVILGGLTAATAVLAQAPAPSSPPPQGQDMMKGHGGMMTGPMDPDQMKQMTRMMENCNRMMERMSEDKSGSPSGSPPAKRN